MSSENSDTKNDVISIPLDGSPVAIPEHWQKAIYNNSKEECNRISEETFFPSRHQRDEVILGMYTYLNEVNNDSSIVITFDKNRTSLNDLLEKAKRFVI